MFNKNERRPWLFYLNDSNGFYPIHAARFTHATSSFANRCIELVVSNFEQL